MSQLLSVGLIVLMICIYFSRSISKEALEILTEQEKIYLEKQIAGFGNRFYLIPMVIGFSGYMIITYLKPSLSNAAFVLFVLFFHFFLFLQFLNIFEYHYCQNYL